MYFSPRYLLVVIGALGALFAPTWIPLLCMALLAFRYPAWEILLMGLLIDFLWLPGGVSHAIPLFTIIAIILVWGLQPLRKEFLFG